MMLLIRRSLTFYKKYIFEHTFHNFTEFKGISFMQIMQNMISNRPLTFYQKRGRAPYHTKQSIYKRAANRNKMCSDFY